MKLIHSFEVSRVSHDICEECDHFVECSSTCVAVEILVKLARIETTEELTESMDNLKTWLDLENSF